MGTPVQMAFKSGERMESCIEMMVPLLFFQMGDKNGGWMGNITEKTAQPSFGRTVTKNG
jgi:hypothetical protein